MESSRRYLLTLSLGALGVVYGDIGTSPLYALKECFMVHHGHQILPTHDNVLGILSLITWSLILVISIKYLVFVLRADNRGEGGILALMSLVKPAEAGRRGVRRGVLIGLGLFGSALLYGDGMITPAITMLSAFEGVRVVTPLLDPWVVPLTVVALVALFGVQRFGTARVGTLFGPLMLVWFAVLAALGVYNIVRAPEVLAAVNPLRAVQFLFAHQVAGYLVLGAVFLVVTGGEALYADMGHFGAKPIRLAWFTAVFPTLLLNYYGQGALLLQTPAAASDPFFLMAPRWAIWPLVILSTLAAAVASQAVISGSFSLTRQAVQLGYLPRMRIQHTSEREIGQIYIPSVNWLLMICAIGLVIGFGAATNLAGAYGVAVTATMGITTALFAVIARERWGWSLGAVLAFAVPFLVIDLAFFGANVVKITDGGWFPILVGLAVFTLMTTWFKGRRLLATRLAEGGLDTDSFLGQLSGGRIVRVRGTAVFLTREQQGVPTALLHNIKHNKVVHERVVLLSVNVEETPHLAENERFEWIDLGEGVYRLILRFGFMEDPDLPELLARIAGPVSFNAMNTSYFLGRESIVATPREGMAAWRQHLFHGLSRNATSAATFFSLPPNQVIELGAQVRM
ncbi:MAG TPA: potassium transporter Kup [Thermoanaerobaculia bacterium]|jgi:KUP system potassium uptake protein|nr:potassium transporter Kup [Thermoanaerobaculia bacterium]